MVSNFYALLIGIDYYEPNSYYKSLKGAVRDINKVASFIEKSLQIQAEQMIRLISPLPMQDSLTDGRSPQRNKPPTYANIVEAFNQITATAQAQDLVYIHYSGHGGRVKTIFPDLKGEGQFDEGLVPMDVGDRGLSSLIFNRSRANVSK
ncbi:MAG: caspase family protein [Microcystaceae cyanobacterium]